MNNAVAILKWELQDALDANADKEYLYNLRRAIMILNKNLFHQKIMGSDPNNEFYGNK